ncbi:hypothetical protein PVAP13_1KG543166 [Panicum virgatum]|uniref:Uncharacterized protein n=1 Tax=Panicum virgatum TaxID=38727 RepID=A0A8T0Y566_PANVG|nr:hypothetical protein PVAP13_1KG543166 [Panicum virgatum]
MWGPPRVPLDPRPWPASTLAPGHGRSRIAPSVPAVARPRRAPAVLLPFLVRAATLPSTSSAAGGAGAAARQPGQADGGTVSNGRGQRRRVSAHGRGASTRAVAEEATPIAKRPRVAGRPWGDGGSACAMEREAGRREEMRGGR